MSSTDITWTAVVSFMGNLHALTGWHACSYPADEEQAEGVLVRVIDYTSACMTDRWEKRRQEIYQGTASHLRFNNNIYIASLKWGHQRADRMEREREVSKHIVKLFSSVCVCLYYLCKCVIRFLFLCHVSTSWVCVRACAREAVARWGERRGGREERGTEMKSERLQEEEEWENGNLIKLTERQTRGSEQQRESETS